MAGYGGAASLANQLQTVPRDFLTTGPGRHETSQRLAEITCRSQVAGARRRSVADEVGGP